MTGRGLLAAMAIVAAMFALPAPAVACSLITIPQTCSGGPCSPAQLRERTQLRAIDYARELNQAIAARDASPATDRAFDLTRILMPNILPPVDFADGASCGPEVEDGFGDEAVPVDVFAAQLRTRFALPADDRQLIQQLSRLRDDCNNETRRGLAAYLRDVLPATQIAELWDFLLRRAGAQVPADGALPLLGGRLTRLSGAALAPDTFADEDHVRRRKERAAHYLRHHDNGIAVMSAINQYLTVRVWPQQSRPEGLCPVAEAAMVRLTTPM